jgi:hypothetical protein
LRWHSQHKHFYSYSRTGIKCDSLCCRYFSIFFNCLTKQAFSSKLTKKYKNEGQQNLWKDIYYEKKIYSLFRNFSESLRLISQKQFVGLIRHWTCNHIIFGSFFLQNETIIVIIFFQLFFHSIVNNLLNRFIQVCYISCN